MNDPSEALVKEYAAGAGTYDKKWWFYVESTTSETVARLKMDPTDSVLDVGCGTGALLSRLAARFPAAPLAGLDPVSEMLDIARTKLSRTVDLRVGWANNLPWPAASFDIVLSCNMFHYVSHPRDAAREILRVLKPGGRVIITDWCDDFLVCRLCSAYLRLVGKPLFKTYRGKEILALLVEAGHERPKIERYKINWLWGLMTVEARKPIAVGTC